MNQLYHSSRLYFYLKSIFSETGIAVLRINPGNFFIWMFKVEIFGFVL